MTVTSDLAAPGSLRSWVRSVRAVVDRPLTPYYLLIGATALLLGIGLMEVLSASSVSSYKAYGNSYHWIGRQAMWVAIGLPTAYLASRLPHRVIRAFAWPAIGISVVLIALTQSGLGVTVNGNRNWLSLGGPIQIQPAEIAKFALILWIADVYARKQRLLSDWRHALIPVVPMVTAITILVVVLGHDLGTGLVLFAIALGLLFVGGAPMRIFVGLSSVVAVFAMTLAASDRERLSRLTSFSDPFAHFDNTGWQSGHGILGMANGGLFGKGIGASQQKWGNLPAPHTDFIFAVLGEELGLVGTLLVLVLFFAIAYAGIRVALHTPDPFVRFMAAGITIWLVAQMLINIGMVLALLPVIGIPLPIVSYGGSSLVPELVAIGLLVSFARHEPGAAAELRGRRRTTRRQQSPTGRVTAVRAGRR